MFMLHSAYICYNRSLSYELMWIEVALLQSLRDSSHDIKWVSTSNMSSQSKTTADLRQEKSGLDLNSGSGLGDPDYFQNFTGTSMSKGTCLIKFSWKSDYFLRRFKPNCQIVKMPHLTVLNNSKNSGSGRGSALHSNPKFNQFFLSTDKLTSAVKIFVEIRLVVLT